MENYYVVKDVSKIVRQYNLKGRSLEFKIKPIPENKEPTNWVKDAITQIIMKATEGVQPEDKVGFTFCSKDFNKGDGWLSFRDASEVTVDEVWGILNSIFQSNSTGLSTDKFCLGVTTVRLPSGRGNNRQSKYNNFEEECGMRRGIVTINNKDNMCLPRALVVGKAIADKDPEYKKVRRDIGKLQTERARKLTVEAHVQIPDNGAGIEEIKHFQDYFKNYKITVYDFASKGRNVIFEGQDTNLKINLLYHKRHYNVISSLTAAFCCSYYCAKCHTPYNTKNKHRCGGTCQSCQQSPPCQIKEKIQCQDCNRWFRSNSCFQQHKKQQSLGKGTVCDQIVCCLSCLKTIKKNRIHTCGEIFCKICKKFQPGNHLCHMQPNTGKHKTKDFLFVFYDLETTQEKKIDEHTVQHEPNLCVFRQCCDLCIIERKLLFCCKKCGVCLQKLNGENCVEIFLQHLLKQRSSFKNIVVLAHNGQAFDHQFILNHVLTKTTLKPELIMRGTKIISMCVGNIKFIDSLNYFPMALSKLPKAFGLGDNFKKGYFPHLFNTRDNQNYVGPIPCIRYYEPDIMKSEERGKLLKWHEEKLAENYVFDFQKEIESYCESDVAILTEACLKFREQLLEAGNVCPFTEATTIASACNKVFRRNFLKPNTIGIIPKGGYRFSDNQSKIALKWLIWEEKQRGINILHAGKQKEVILHGLKVDGFSPDTNQVFEFHGCYYHGHPKCLKFDRHQPLHDNPHESLNMRYESTVAKNDRLRNFGYEVIEMWHCDFSRLLNEEIDNYTENHPLIAHEPMNPRDSFYGGRTGNTRTYYEIKPGEKIKYIDICSLYPWSCKYGKFPIGHPRVYVGEECPKELADIEGLIKCRILPPQNLYHPVLPAKINKKLLFTLCRSCSTSVNYGDCDHNNEERALTGTWVLDEVKKALEMGYEIIEIIELWHYSIEKYDDVTKSGGLFTEMMNKFLKIKQQASGWPKNCITREQRDKYIEEFLNAEGIKLKYEDIVENAGLRALAKLMLNSFWGKLGQRENQPKTKIVNKPDEFFNMLCDSAIDVNTVLPINDNTLVVNYEYKEEAYDLLPTINVCLASFVTAQARLRLFKYLTMLGDKVLYYDTDSVIYISRAGEPEPETGTNVGDMTDELEVYGSGSYITEFASGGPKNYGYVVYSPTQNKYFKTCKVKGISINHEIAKDVNFDRLKDMILNNEQPRKILYKNFERTETHDVVIRDKEKIFRPNSTKRKFEGLDSVPFGFKKQRN